EESISQKPIARNPPNSSFHGAVHHREGPSPPLLHRRSSREGRSSPTPTRQGAQQLPPFTITSFNHHRDHPAPPVSSVVRRPSSTISHHHRSHPRCYSLTTNRGDCSRSRRHRRPTTPTSTLAAHSRPTPIIIRRHHRRPPRRGGAHSAIFTSSPTPTTFDDVE
ncbi:hypothetical protein Dimus_036797, partial [Dionaea muscipula]